MLKFLYEDEDGYQMYQVMMSCGKRAVEPPTYACEYKHDEGDFARYRITDVMWLWDDNEYVNYGNGVMSFHDHIWKHCNPAHGHLLQFLSDCGELE